MTGDRVVVVDVGSNSTRLFLCDGIGIDGPIGERLTTVTALRRGAGPDGTVTPDALARLDACLAGYAGSIDAFDPDAEILPVGTSAVRDAPNRDAIARIVGDRLGAELRVLSGAEEAELSYTGARLAVHGPGPILVMDIGGGSTELVRGTEEGPGAAVSMDIGVVRCTDALLHDDPPAPAQIEELRWAVVATVVPVIAAVGGPAPVVAVAGTATTIAAIVHGEYDPDVVHGMVVTAEQVDAVAERVAAVGLEERRAIPGLHPDRAPSIVAGTVIAGTILGAAFAGEMTVSERDLLDGAVMKLAGRGEPG